MPVATKEVSHSTVVFMRASRHIDLTSSGTGSKGLCFGLLACILFPLIHLFLECPRLFLVYERQASHTLFQLEGMEKGAILVVLESVIDFLVPDHASICGRHIYQFNPEGVSHQVVAEDGGPLQACVGPSVSVGMGNVEASDGNSLDLVGGLWYCAFHRLFILFRQDGRHDGEW